MEPKQIDFFNLVETVIGSISTLTPPEHFLNQVLTKLTSELAVDSSWIWLVDHQKEELNLTAYTGLTPEIVTTFSQLNLNQYPFGKVAQSGEPVISPDISIESGFDLAAVTRLHSLLVVPIKLGNKVLGVIGLGSKEINKFTNYELRVLSVIAAYLAIATELTWLHQKTEEKEKQIEAISHLTAAITSTTTIDEIYDSFKSEFRKAIHADWIEVTLIEGDKLRFIVLAPEQLPIESMELEKMAGIIPLAGTPAELIAQNPQPIIEKDLSKERRFWTSEYHYEWGLRSLAYLPLIAAGNTFGTLIIGSKLPETFTSKELPILEHFARQLALSLRNLKLYQEDAQKAQFISTIAELAKIINSGADLNEIFQDFVAKLKELADFDLLTIEVIEGEKTKLIAAFGIGVPGLFQGNAYPLSDSALNWLKEHKMANIEKDLTWEHQFPIDNILLQSGLKSALRVPLLARGEVFGSLNLFSIKPDAYSTKQARLLEQLASLISGAIQALHLYALEKSQRQELEQQEKQRQQFLSALSHELQTPLTALIASAGLLSEEFKKEPGSPQHRLVQNIIHSASNLENRLRELLDLARATTIGFKVKKEPVNFPALTQEAIASLLPLIRNKGQSLLLEIPPSLTVIADEQRLEQILFNLLSNAIKFTPEGGQITFRAREEEKNLIIEVQDTGPGISKEEQAKLFRPYYQVLADRQRAPGLGLGLAITKQLVELHGGRIWVESELGKGSTFIVSLPIQQGSNHEGLNN